MPRLDEAVAEEIVRAFAREIGLGYHPDTPLQDYEPELEYDWRLPAIHNFALNILGERVYDVAQDEWKQAGLTRGTREDEDKRTAPGYGVGFD